MSGHHQKSSTNPSRDAVRRDDDDQDARHASFETETISSQQLARLADLVACGDLPVPVDLHPDQLENLVRAVRRRRRDRLVDHVARAIALDIARSREQSKKGHCDVAEQI